MRLAFVLLALLTLPAFAGAAGSETVVEPYTGTSVRDPLLGPHPICASEAGQNIGGACYDIPFGAATVSITVDERVSLGQQLVTLSFYRTADVGLPLDGVTYCPKDGHTWTWGTRGAARVVVSVAPADVTMRDCITGPGTGGTVTFSSH